jgi:localization factor PodJL
MAAARALRDQAEAESKAAEAEIAEARGRAARTAAEAKARAAAQAWHAKPPLAEANGVSSPDGGWDGPGNTLGEGDRQALVKKIQALLAEQGFDPGPADGVVGQKTRDAVRAYQHKNGIAETGQIDSKVVASLTNRPM